MKKIKSIYNSILVENKKFNTKLISAFPGSGKSHFFKTSNKKVLDSDSSTFDKKDFPSNYIKHIKEKMGTVDYILISSHKDVRDALKENNLNYTLVYPNKELKEDYLKRYKERGSPKSFIELLKNNWDSWVDEMNNESFPKTKKLKKDQYLSDII